MDDFCPFKMVQLTCFGLMDDFCPFKMVQLTCFGLMDDFFAQGTTGRQAVARVELPITDHYLIIHHFFRSSSSVLHFEQFKMLWECYYLKF
jgi:hypothetical protein